MIVVVGMAFEARIAAGLGVPIVCGGDGQHLAASLARAMAAGCGGLISFGVAGGLAPHLKPGNCVIGSGILDNGTSSRPTRAGRSASCAFFPDTVHGPILGVREPIAHADDKAALHREDRRARPWIWSRMWWRAPPHGTAFHSPQCGSWSTRSSAPFRDRRSQARAPDGTIDPLAVMRSLLRCPRDFDRPAPDVARCACGSRDAGAGQRVARSRSRLAGRVAAYHRACRRSLAAHR